MIKKYKSIIFDWDGTLIDSEKPRAIALLYLLQKKHNQTTLTINDIIPKMGSTGSTILRNFGVAEELIEEYLNEWINAVDNESQKPVEIFEEVDSLLVQLTQKSIPCGIVSSKNREIYENEQEYLKLNSYFQHVILAEDTDFQKPHPAPLLSYLDQIKLPASECIYIGDNFSDFLCAQNCGMDFGFAHWNKTAILHHTEGVIIFDHPLDILKLV